VHRVQLSNLIPGKTYRMKKKSLKWNIFLSQPN
jgi:hypothetical protein